MLNSLIFIALPYIALAMLVLVTPYRYRINRLTWTAYSSQFLEGKLLFWGSVPWHYGIIPVLLAHLAGFLFPGFMQSLLGNQETLVALESIGLALGLLSLVGIAMLFLRRSNSSRVKEVTSGTDWLILLLLLFQSGTGVFIATSMRWGSLWYLHTAVPYLWSLLRFDPQLAYVADFPIAFKLHVACAFLIIAVIPFTKLVHLFYLPVNFLRDPPLLYRWRRPGA